LLRSQTEWTECTARHRQRATRQRQFPQAALSFHRGHTTCVPGTRTWSNPTKKKLLLIRRTSKSYRTNTPRTIHGDNL
jgi:hypothetical protein